MAKSDVGQEWVATDVCQMIRDVVAGFMEWPEAVDLEFRTNLPDDSVFVETQPTRLRHVAENLIGNAVRYSDPNKPHRFVEASVVDLGQRVEFSVADNGLGIPADRHREVFGLFKRFHPDHSNGTGLGLALLKKHIDHLGGEVTFESSPGGTIFRTLFPRRSNHAEHSNRD